MSQADNKDGNQQIIQISPDESRPGTPVVQPEQISSEAEAHKRHEQDVNGSRSGSPIFQPQQRSSETYNSKPNDEQDVQRSLEESHAGSSAVQPQVSISKTAPDISQVPFWSSARVSLAILGFFGFANLYSLKVNISVAIVCMIKSAPAVVAVNTSMWENTTGSTILTTTAMAAKCMNTIAHREAIDGEFSWSSDIQAQILGAFFYGYITTQLLGGYLANIYGGKVVFGGFMFLCAIATLLIPIAARTSYIVLILMRVITGIGQGVVWPSMAGIWAYWAPPDERSKLVGFTFAGAQIGNVLTFPLAALLCQYGFDGGWPSIFYVLGTTGVIWCIAWMLLAYDTPDDHPRISEIEKNYIHYCLAGQVGARVGTQLKIPWRKFFTSTAVWAIIVNHTTANWMTYTFLTNTPTYMKEVLKFDIKSNGLLSAIPYLGMWGAIVLTGVIADKIKQKKLLSLTNIRKLFITVGEVIPAILIIVLGYFDCTQPGLAVFTLALAISLSGCPYSSGYMVNHSDIAPKYAAILFGISNTAATVPGFLAPYFVGLITIHKKQSEWQFVFYVTAGITLCGWLFYMIFGTAELQDWAKEEVIKLSPEEKQNLAKVEKHLTAVTGEKTTEVAIPDSDATQSSTGQEDTYIRYKGIHVVRQSVQYHL